MTFHGVGTDYFGTTHWLDFKYSVYTVVSTLNSREESLVSLCSGFILA